MTPPPDANGARLPALRRAARRTLRTVAGRLRTLVINGGEWVSRLSGVDAWLRSRRQDHLLVLCYHGIIPDECPPSPRRLDSHPRQRAFRQQLQILSRRFNVVSAATVLDHVRSGTPLPKRPALITFDDGLRNNLTCAAPELDRFGLTALVFLPTDHIGDTRLLWTHEVAERVVAWRPTTLPQPAGLPDHNLRHGDIDRWNLATQVLNLCKSLPEAERAAYVERLRQEPLRVDPVWRRDVYAFLSWDEVKQLQARGWTIGSHTLTHPILHRVPPEQLRRELTLSRQRIEQELGCPCPCFAYPNGATTPDVTRAVAATGYEMAFVLDRGLNPRSLQKFEVIRINIATIRNGTFLSLLGGLRSLRRRRSRPTGTRALRDAE